MQRRISRKNLSFLALLYFVQGLPFGFQATALPVLLRARGVSLTNIGLLSLLAAPWLLKLLWAPLVDRWASARFGRRKSWIVPLQVALAVTTAGAALLDPARGLEPLLLAVLAMNFFAATMDIAVDGLAVDLLHADELGLGNSAQVVGYKVGILTGGGLLVWLSGSLGFAGLLGSMSALVAAVTLLTVLWKEPPSTKRDGAAPVIELAYIFELLRKSVKRPGAAWLFAAVGTYKLGETMADTMFKPFAVDNGLTPAQIGLWFGTWGTSSSLLGSLLGGWLATRFGVARALGTTALLRVAPLAALALASATTPNNQLLIAIMIAEHACGGALTTAMFAFMMSRVDRAIGATHYTLFATVEVLGKAPGAWSSGAIAERFGYPALFGAAALLSLAFLPVLARGLGHAARERT